MTPQSSVLEAANNGVISWTWLTKMGASLICHSHHKLRSNPDRSSPPLYLPALLLECAQSPAGAACQWPMRGPGTSQTVTAASDGLSPSPGCALALVARSLPFLFQSLAPPYSPGAHSS